MLRDNIPLVSWIVLSGRCRTCKTRISPLYPAIELITALSLSAMLYFIEPTYWFSYVIFFSALIISIRTDLETMLLSRYVTLGLIPFGFFLSYKNMLPITLEQSIIGCLSGFLFLFMLERIYFVISKRVGLGQGDIELLAGIGAFLGFIGWWITLIIASCLGTIIGSCMILIYKKPMTELKIPFGPFLALGAMLYGLFSSYFLAILS